MWAASLVKDSKDYDLPAFLSKVDGIGEAPQERAACRPLHLRIALWASQNALEGCIEFLQNGASEPVGLSVVPRYRRCNVGFGGRKESQCHE